MGVRHLLCVGVSFAVSAVFAAVPECTRVLPGVDFPRRQVLDHETVVLHARVGRDGERGLVLVRSQQDPDRQYFQVALPNGAGGLWLGPETDIPPLGWGLAYPQQLLAGDVDGDGIDDAVLWWSQFWGAGEAVVDFFHGVGDGRFEQTSRLSFGSAPPQRDPMALGDFDADGRLEIALLLANLWSTSVSSLFMIEPDDSGQVVVRTAIDVARPVVPNLAVVDWDGNGIDDVAYLISRGEWSAIGFGLGTPDTPFAVSEGEYLPYPVLRLSAANRRLLAIEGTAYWLPILVAVHQPYPGDYPLSDNWVIPLPLYSGWHEPLDVDGDGLEDILTGDWASMWGGAVGFDVHWAEACGPPLEGPRSAGWSYPIASMDVNGDGVRDLVTNDFAVLPQRTPRQVDEGLFGATLTEGFNDEPGAFLSVGDLNEDGLDDVVAQTFWADSFTVDLARGDGTFDVVPLDVDPRSFRDPKTIDLDGDGHLDLAAPSGGRSVAWGHGDGTFGPWQVQEYARINRAFGDIDGDGTPDAVEFVFEDTEHATLRTALGGARTWRDTGFAEPLSSADYSLSLWSLADLDGDSRTDLVLRRGTAVPWKPARLVWRPSLGDGSFGPERAIEDGAFEGGIADFEPVDFDLDGTMDLFVVTYETPWPELKYYVSLRNAGQGRFERIWTGEPIPFSYGMEDRLAEVDGDGRPDLVYGQYDPYFGPPYYLRVRRGDGFGGFLASEPVIWLGPAGPTGRFREAGTRDVVKVHQRGIQRMTLELLPSLGHVLAADEGPPSVELRLSPVIDTTSQPITFDEHWRVASTPIDECDSRPKLLRRLIALVPTGPATPVTFRRSSQLEVEVYEVPGSRTPEVLLSGPDETEARQLFAAAASDGGLAFDNWATLQLASGSAYGPERGPTNPASRLAQRFVFAGDRLVSAAETRPGPGLTFALVARDRAGNTGTTRVRYADARAEALAKACRDAVVDPFLCETRQP